MDRYNFEVGKLYCIKAKPGYDIVFQQNPLFGCWNGYGPSPTISTGKKHESLSPTITTKKKHESLTLTEIARRSKVWVMFLGLADHGAAWVLYDESTWLVPFWLCSPESEAIEWTTVDGLRLKRVSNENQKSTERES